MQNLVSVYMFQLFQSISLVSYIVHTRVWKYFTAELRVFVPLLPRMYACPNMIIKVHTWTGYDNKSIHGIYAQRMCMPDSISTAVCKDMCAFMLVFACT